MQGFLSDCFLPFVPVSYLLFPSLVLIFLAFVSHRGNRKTADGSLLRGPFTIRLAQCELNRNPCPAFYEIWFLKCLAQASATPLSAFSSPGIIAQLCFSI